MRSRHADGCEEHVLEHPACSLPRGWSSSCSMHTDRGQLLHADTASRTAGSATDRKLLDIIGWWYIAAKEKRMWAHVREHAHMQRRMHGTAAEGYLCLLCHFPTTHCRTIDHGGFGRRQEAPAHLVELLCHSFCSLADGSDLGKPFVREILIGSTGSVQFFWEACIRETIASRLTPNAIADMLTRAHRKALKKMLLTKTHDKNSPAQCAGPQSSSRRQPAQPQHQEACAY